MTISLPPCIILQYSNLCPHCWACPGALVKPLLQCRCTAWSSPRSIWYNTEYSTPQWWENSVSFITTWLFKLWIIGVNHNNLFKLVTDFDQHTHQNVGAMRIWTSGGRLESCCFTRRTPMDVSAHGWAEHLRLQLVKASSYDDSDRTTSLHGRLNCLPWSEVVQAEPW